MKKEMIIDSILEKELAMFVAVPSENEAPCQQNPEGFRVFRSAQFSVWSIDTLVSYLHDLDMAETEGKNLMTLKYARMDELIAELHANPDAYKLIDKVVSIELNWQRSMLSKYPSFMNRARIIEEQHQDDRFTSFKRYLRAELETYSYGTLQSLFDDVFEAELVGKNLTESMYNLMVKDLGYDDLPDAERELSQQKNSYACRSC